MNTSDRQLKLLMNQELLIAYDEFFNDLALLVAMKEQLSGKDDLCDEDRFNDEVLENIFQERDRLLPIFDGAADNLESFEDFLHNTQIVDPCLEKGILWILDYREEQNMVQDSVFSPYGTTLKEVASSYVERLLVVKRMHAIVKDVQEGIQQYDVASYLVPENAYEIDVLSALEELSFKNRVQELTRVLTKGDFETEEEKENQKNQLALLLMIQKGDKQHE